MEFVNKGKGQKARFKFNLLEISQSESLFNSWFNRISPFGSNRWSDRRVEEIFI